MQFVDFFVAALALIALAGSALVVWKVRNLRFRFIEARGCSVEQMLTAIGRVKSLNEVETRTPVIIAAMERHNVASLIIPLGAGGRVNLRLTSSDYIVKSA